jgi:hypothetical protein
MEGVVPGANQIQNLLSFSFPFFIEAIHLPALPPLYFLGHNVGASKVRALPVATINGIIGPSECVRQRLAFQPLLQNVVCHY